METTTIRGTDLEPSRIGLGTWAIGGTMWGGTDEGEALDTIQAALDKGINLIDTAPAYGFGRSEEIVGKALQQTGSRTKVVLATKVGLEWDDEGNIRRNSSKDRIRKEVEDSLRRLGTSWIDVYQVHWPDAQTPLQETAEALLKLRMQGKIRAIGVSNYSSEQMEVFRQIAPVQVLQPPYNLFERGAEKDALPYARARDITTFTYGVLCRGLLSGAIDHDREFEGDDLRKSDPKFQEPRFSNYLEAVQKLDEYAREEHGNRVVHLAIRWALDQPGVSCVLLGARKTWHLNPVDPALGLRLTRKDYDAISKILHESIDDPVGPEFMAPPE